MYIPFKGGTCICIYVYMCTQKRVLKSTPYDIILLVSNSV